MFGLTPLGIVHTAFSLAALAAAALSLARDGAISLRSGPGRAYVAATVLACLLSLGIMRHGGFGGGHVLALLILAVLAASAFAGRAQWRRAEAAGYSFSLLPSLVPGVIETFTRMPVGAPLLDGPEDPRLQPMLGGLLLAFVVGLAWQLRRLGRQAR